MNVVQRLTLHTGHLVATALIYIFAVLVYVMDINLNRARSVIVRIGYDEEVY